MKNIKKMILYLFLIFLQIKTVKNTAVIPSSIGSITYVIPLKHGSSIYLFGNNKVIYTSDMSSFSVSNTDTSDLTSTTDATTPLYDGIYIITYTKSSDTFKYVKKKVGYGNSYSPKTVSTRLKNNGNVCLFK